MPTGVVGAFFACTTHLQLRGIQARGEASGTPDKTTVTEAVKKLTSLIKQLDSLLPYLSVAISAVNLLNAGKVTHNETHAITCAAHTSRIFLPDRGLLGRSSPFILISMSQCPSRNTCPMLHCGVGRSPPTLSPSHLMGASWQMINVLLDTDEPVPM